MKTISSLQNQEILYLSKLNDSKNIIKNKEFLLEGKNLLFEAKKVSIIKTILFIEENLSYAKEFVENTKINLVLVNKKIIKRLSQNESNFGLIAICEYKTLTIDFKNIKRLIVLDSINNPGNLGTVARTASAFGYDAIVTLNESVFTHNNKVIKASQGAIFKIPIIKIDDLDLIANFNFYKFSLDNDSIFLDKNKINPKTPYGLVFGNESNGISEEVHKKLKGTSIKIPMNNMESLNVSAAAAIAMYCFCSKK